MRVPKGMYILALSVCVISVQPTTHGARVVSSDIASVGTNSDLFTIEEPLERDIDDSLSTAPGRHNAMLKQW